MIIEEIHYHIDNSKHKVITVNQNHLDIIIAHVCTLLTHLMYPHRLYPVFAEIIMSSHLSCADKEELILMTCLLLPERHLLSLKVSHLYKKSTKKVITISLFLLCLGSDAAAPEGLCL